MNIFRSKYNRFLEGEKLRVLDLFAGCGGLSLGFQSEGFEVLGAIENDIFAAKTHAINFHTGKINCNQDVDAIDITEIDPETYINKNFKNSNIQNTFDIIIGGPPCQAFARVGRAKLREVSEHPEAFLQDPRSNLYLSSLHV